MIAIIKSTKDNTVKSNVTINFDTLNELHGTFLYLLFNM